MPIKKTLRVNALSNSLASLRQPLYLIVQSVLSKGGLNGLMDS